MAGAPDPYVEITEGDQLRVTTSAQRDTFSPTWNEFAELVLVQNGPATGFAMFDDDVGSSDLMMGSEMAPEGWLQIVREMGGMFSWTDSGMTITVRVVPLYGGRHSSATNTGALEISTSSAFPSRSSGAARRLLGGFYEWRAIRKRRAMTIRVEPLTASSRYASF